MAQSSLSGKRGSSKLKVLARSRSRYNDVYVIEDGDVREMWFKGGGKFFLQSRFRPDDPLSLMLVYSKMTFSTLLFHPRPKRMLVIGLGGGTVSNCLNAWYPEAQIDVVEIDPIVIALAKEYFKVKSTDRYRVIEEDGRVFVKEQIQKGVQYDIIYIDAFKSGSIPYHLKTQEFYQELRQALAPDGVVASNLYGKSNSLKPRDRKTFTDVFKQIYIFEDEGQVATVSVATLHDTAWTREKFQQVASSFDAPKRMHIDMNEVVETLKDASTYLETTEEFHDDFSEQEFSSAVDRNNRQLEVKRPYPISNVG